MPAQYNETLIVKDTRVNKRAKYNREIENYKDQILRFYCVDGWTLEQIRQELANNYGLNLTSKQVFGRINKWGGRKNINRKEWINAKRQIGYRQAEGKQETELVFNCITIISGKRLSKGLARNHESFTERVFRQVEKNFGHTSFLGPKERPGDEEYSLQVATPINYDQLEFLKARALFPRRIPLGTLERLPIYVATQLLSQTLNLTMHPELPQQLIFRKFPSILQDTPNQENLDILKGLFFTLSNNVDEPSRVFDLLDEIDQKGYATLLKHFLTIKSRTTAVIAEDLIYYSIIRQDHDLTGYILRTYAYLRVDYYRLLHEMRERCILLEVEGKEKPIRTIHDVISIMKTQDCRPESVVDTVTLMELCRDELKNVQLFTDLWDPSLVPVKSIEDYCAFNRTILSPHLCGDVQNIELLLQLGFSQHLDSLLIYAIIKDDLETVLVAMKYWNRVSLPETSYIHPRLGPKRRSKAWNVVGIVIFNALLESSYLLEQDSSLFRSKYGHPPLAKYIPTGASRRDCTYTDLIVFLACINPDALDFLLQLLELHSRADLEANLADCFRFEYTKATPLSLVPHFKDHCWKVVPCPLNTLLVLTRLFEMGYSPTNTAMWQHKIWKLLLFHARGVPPHRRYPYQNKPLKLSPAFTDIVKIFIEAGADVELRVETPLLKAFGIFAPVDFPNKDLTPIEVAFALPEPELFLILLSKGAKMTRFNNPEYVLPGDGGKIAPGVWPLLQSRSKASSQILRSLWDMRSEKRAIESDPLHLLIELCNNSMMLEAKAVFGMITCRMKRLAALDFIAWKIPGLMRHADGGRLAQILLEMIKSWALDSQKQIKEYMMQGLNPEGLESLWRHYFQVVEGVIRLDEVKIFAAFLFDRETTEYLDTCGSIYGWVKAAARQSTDCLKLLMTSWGNDLLIRPGRESVLIQAIAGTNLNSVVYILEQGVDIVSEPNEPSHLRCPLEYAIELRRLDILALFLEVQPQYHSMALGFAEKHHTANSELARFVREWTPRDLIDEFGEVLSGFPLGPVSFVTDQMDETL